MVGYQRANAIGPVGAGVRLFVVGSKMLVFVTPLFMFPVGRASPPAIRTWPVVGMINPAEQNSSPTRSAFGNVMCVLVTGSHTS